MRDKTSWFIRVWDDTNPSVYGLGECGPLPYLSKELTPEFEAIITNLVSEIQSKKITLPAEGWKDIDSMKEFFGTHSLSSEYSSFVFALETAILDLVNGGTRLIFNTRFTDRSPIPINALVWMGGLDFMLQQVEIKIRDGYKVVKLKVGGLDFEKECDVLQYIRRKYFRDKIEIRLDANGAFKKDEALQKIQNLKRFQVHSIEQPLKPGMPEMEQLCRESPIPIAFDEELIGVNTLEQKEALLRNLKPQFIILKPTLHGGICGCHEWIQIANNNKIGWWITSALESNIGLNAIAQFTAQYPIEIAQGLGTGQIYTNNFPSPLEPVSGFLHYNKKENWDLTNLFPSEAEESLYLKN
jgi:o-succinylbenzoate synthase